MSIVVTLHGTSPDELVAQSIQVLDAASALEDALKKAVPNGRDYADSSATVAAQVEWRKQMEKLNEIKRWATDRAITVQEQEG